MTWENGRSLPVLCLVLSQNRMTHHEICNVPVERNGREKKGREEGGEREKKGREEGGEREKKGREEGGEREVGKEGKEEEEMEGREGKREERQSEEGEDAM